MNQDTARGQTGVILAVIGWLLITLVGMAVLVRYEQTPGPINRQPSHWPANSSLYLHDDGHTLILFAHPRCPCTRASLRELQRLMSRLGGRVEATVAFLQPAGQARDWSETDLWDLAGKIPHTRRFRDLRGREASRFGASTSGHTVLFDTKGRRVFSGGITISRGHEGNSPGRAAIERHVSGSAKRPDNAPVFGCCLRTAPPKVTGSVSIAGERPELPASMMQQR